MTAATVIVDVDNGNIDDEQFITRQETFFLRSNTVLVLIDLFLLGSH